MAGSQWPSHRVPEADSGRALQCQRLGLPGGDVLPRPAAGRSGRDACSLDRESARRNPYADAFFPLLLRHWGHYENLPWSWQVTQVIPVVIAVSCSRSSYDRVRGAVRVLPSSQDGAGVTTSSPSMTSRRVPSSGRARTSSASRVCWLGEHTHTMHASASSGQGDTHQDCAVSDAGQHQRPAPGNTLTRQTPGARSRFQRGRARR